jgi:hypothetical protein
MIEQKYCHQKGIRFLLDWIGKIYLRKESNPEFFLCGAEAREQILGHLGKMKFSRTDA